MGSLNTIKYDSPKILPINVYHIDMKNHYKRPSPQDLGWDDLRPDFRSFDGNNIETWNIDEWFTGNLRSWWHNHLTDANREAIKDAVLEKTEQGPNGDVVTTQPNSVNTLVYVAIKHFIGRTTLYSDQPMEGLLGMKCPKMSDFKWYKDTFMSRLYNLMTCRDVVWKHKYVEGLPKYVKEKFYSTMVTNSGRTDIDWEVISDGDINSTIQKVCLEIFQQQKHATKIAKDSDYRRKMGSFCKQYEIDNTPSRKKSRSKKVFKRSKTSESHGYSNRKRKYHGKSRNKRKFFKENTTCFKCNKKGHYANRCPVVRKINLMEIDEDKKQSLSKVIKAEELSSEEEEFSFEKEEDLLNVLLEESSEEPSSSENETDSEEAISYFGCINVLTSTQKGLLDIIEEVDDEAIRKKILLRLREDLETPDQKFKDPMNFSFQAVMNLLPKEHAAPVKVIDLYHEIEVLKKEINENKQQISYLKNAVVAIQEQIISKENIETQSADQNMIHEGIIPSKYFEITRESLK
ncbi:polyprotein [Cucumis melo var. makuwa]|uniref:Polyprotein n=1 Tax=Cucumis melo var. makuwa TaxID=1194695 RepID=A0A5D3C457_CUCMM|nr:polyprotein [Cucumis melo var. makuwa]TYK06627.1 polyprotein [Cucumis melo var. makuwa]